MTPQGVTQSDLQSLIEAYRKAEQDIIESIESNPLKTRRDKELLLAQIRLTLAELNSKSDNIIDTNLFEEWQKGIEEVDGAIPGGATVSSFVLQDTAVTLNILQTLDVIKDSTKSQIRELLNNSNAWIQKTLYQVDQQVRQDLLKAVAEGNIKGKGVRSVSKELIAIIQEQGITGFTTIDKNGKQRKYSLDSTAEVIVRSAMIQSRAQSVLRRAVERGLDLVRVSHHGNESPMCAPFSGEIYSITGQTEGYKPLADVLWDGTYRRGSGLFHPRCRHSFTVIVPTDIPFNT